MYSGSVARFGSRDTTAGVGLDLVLVNDPVKGGAVAEAVVVRRRGQARERQGVVGDHRRFAFASFILRTW